MNLPTLKFASSAVPPRAGGFPSGFDRTSVAIRSRQPAAMQRPTSHSSDRSEPSFSKRIARTARNEPWRERAFFRRWQAEHQGTARSAAEVQRKTGAHDLSRGIWLRIPGLRISASPFFPPLEIRCGVRKPRSSIFVRSAPIERLYVSRLPPAVTAVTICSEAAASPVNKIEPSGSEESREYTKQEGVILNEVKNPENVGASRISAVRTKLQQPAPALFYFFAGATFVWSSSWPGFFPAGQAPSHFASMWIFTSPRSGCGGGVMRVTRSTL